MKQMISILVVVYALIFACKSSVDRQQASEVKGSNQINKPGDNERILEINRLLENMLAEGKKVDIEVIKNLFESLDKEDAEKVAISDEKKKEIAMLTEQYNASLGKSENEHKKASDELKGYINSLAQQVVTSSLLNNTCQKYLAKLGKCADFPTLSDCTDVSHDGYQALCSRQEGSKMDCQTYLTKKSKCLRFPTLSDCADLSKTSYEESCSKE